MLLRKLVYREILVLIYSNKYSGKIQWSENGKFGRVDAFFTELLKNPGDLVSLTAFLGKITGLW